MSAETTKRSRSKKVTNSDNVDNTVIQQNDIREINVEVSKYGALDSILSSNKKTIRVLGLLFSIAIFLFLVIFVVSISLKRIYSYSDITTNALGATTISSENSSENFLEKSSSESFMKNEQSDTTEDDLFIPPPVQVCGAMNSPLLAAPSISPVTNVKQTQ